VSAMALIESIITFTISFLLLLEVCSRNVELSKILCPVAVATLLALLSYVAL